MVHKPRDWFADAFGVAIEDVRHKLVEEGWFGRTVTPAHSGMAESLGWEAGQTKAPVTATASVHVAMMFSPPAAEGEEQKQDEQQQRIRGLSL